MVNTFYSFKSLRSYFGSECGKGLNLRGKEVYLNMVMRIDRSGKNCRRTLLTNIGWTKENKRNILNAIFEIKDFIYFNLDYFKEAYKKFSNQSEYTPAVKGQLNFRAVNKKKFLESKNKVISTTLYDLTKRVKLTYGFLEKSSKPQNVKDLFLKIKEDYFDVDPPNKGSKNKL